VTFAPPIEPGGRPPIPNLLPLDCPPCTIPLRSLRLLSGQEGTQQHICAMMNKEGEIMVLKSKSVETTDQDYAGHHEAKQTDRDDGAPDHTGLPVEFFVL